MLELKLKESAAPDMNLSSKIIMVTGSAGHLGKAVCKRLSNAGASLILNGRSEHALVELRNELQNIGAPCMILPFDVTDQLQAERAFGRIADRYGVLDGLVNNAYSGSSEHWRSVEMQDFDLSLKSNISANFVNCRFAYDLMRSQRSGSIVNVASMYGSVSPDPGIYGDSGMDNPPQYGAGKAGLVQLTRYLACHWGSEGIRVNAVSPGPFPSPEIQKQAPEFVEQLRAKTPLGRLGNSEELGGAVQFLLSDAAAYITGVNLPVDGGWTAW